MKNVHGDEKSVKNVREKFGEFCPSASVSRLKFEFSSILLQYTRLFPESWSEKRFQDSGMHTIDSLHRKALYRLFW